ncbi:Transposase [Glycomyces harbinensis]|uniref:Transposase n=2 Tax=Glycomyces harbinensis TaxID=58114 RepID=A0A1G6XQA6_9ACTN|nr:Transposase [Glycomyces harbinensis]
MKASGFTAAFITGALGVSSNSVYNWARWAREGWPAGLDDKRPERKSAMDSSMRAELASIIESTTPEEHGFDSLLWTREIAAAVVKERFGVVFSPKWIGRILTDLGFTPQRPRYRSDRADPALVEQWRTETFPAIAARAQDAGAEIFFGDESAVQLGFHAGTTWGRKGQTPVVTAAGPVGGRKTIMMVSAISRRGQLRFRLHSGSFDAVAVVDFCKRLLSTADRPVFLIVDNARVHHAKIVKAFEALTEGRLCLFYLPPYSPQLNPDELVWSTVKNGRIGKAVIRNEHDLKRVVLGALRSLQKLPETVKRLFNHPELAYITAAQPE